MQLVVIGPEFNFPEWGVYCRICEEEIPLDRYRSSGLCDDCEFDTLTPPLWVDQLQAAMEKWKK